MHSKRSLEGWLSVDHRDSPGISDAVATRAGLPLGSGRGLCEMATLTCSHCQAGIMVNPLRTRDRAYCRKCDAYICDDCQLAQVMTGVCKTFKQFTAEVQEKAEKGLPIPIFERISTHG